MPLVGTAGHVDHGKSTLIQRLTGRDPDRWAEEKERGLTIDLGFAWSSINDRAISFVDVPGHERYLKNMLAGIEAIDVALFVVAADEGWMPQSEEHLAVLDLLDVKHGVVALTKTDAVDSDLIELASIEIEEKLAGTSLEGADIVPVSAKTNDGIAGLTERMGALLSLINPSDLGRPRLWIDRSFSASGAGTIVTGTLLGGSLTVGGQVLVLPSNETARIRAIQSHEESMDRVDPGRRVALNVTGVDRETVNRGDVLVLPAQWDSSRRFAATLRLARYVEEFEKRGAYQIHIGTLSQPVEVLGYEDGIAVMATRNAIPVAVGDRFIIRDTGRKLVVAGGRVVDPSPGPTKRALSSSRLVDPDTTPDEIATLLLDIRGSDLMARLAAHSQGGSPNRAVVAGDTVVTTGRFDQIRQQALQMVEDEHDEHPLRVGIPMATLVEKLGVGTALTEALIDSSADFERRGPDVAVAGRVVEIPATVEMAWSETKRKLSAGLDVPSESDLGLSPEHLHLRIRREELIRISDALVYLPEQIDALIEIIRSLPEQFSVADFRDAAGLSRKYVVPILEWADVEGLTVRRGDTRTVR